MECQDQSWIQSQMYQFSPIYVHVFRIKAALRSGEMQVPRDQWLIFIYTHCEYDPEDTWKGVFRSPILVTVSET